MPRFILLYIRFNAPVDPLVLIGQPLLQGRCFAGLHRIVKISLFHFVQFDSNACNLAGELERDFIVNLSKP